MFDELTGYKNNDHFFLNPDDSLADVCNAPQSTSGVYIVYELAHGDIELIYIGSSGKVLNDGTIKHRDGGLYDRIVNGKQFGKPRNKSWPEKMKQNQSDALDIYWYETVTGDSFDPPSYIEALITMKHLETFGRLPRWNEEF